MSNTTTSLMERVTSMVSEKAVAIFSKSTTCFICHTIVALFREFEFDMAVHEVDNIPEGRDVEQALMRLGCTHSVPAVFISGKLVGGTNEVMSLHLSRSLVPWLQSEGALWV